MRKPKIFGYIYVLSSLLVRLILKCSTSQVPFSQRNFMDRTNLSSLPILSRQEPSPFFWLERRSSLASWENGISNCCTLYCTLYLSFQFTKVILVLFLGDGKVLRVKIESAGKPSESDHQTDSISQNCFIFIYFYQQGTRLGGFRLKVVIESFFPSQAIFGFQSPIIFLF